MGVRPVASTRQRGWAVTEPQDEPKEGVGGVDPKREVGAKGTETRSQLFKDADRTELNPQEIVEYQRAEPPGPLLHR